MIYIKYKTYEGQGPDRFLSGASDLGYESGSWIYGATPSLDVDLTAFSASVCSEVDYLRAQGKVWEAFEASGYTHTNGINIAIKEDDLNKWSQTLVLLREAGVDNTGSFAISDVNGTLHEMSVGEVRYMLVSAGNYWYSNWTLYKSNGSASFI